MLSEVLIPAFVILIKKVDLQSGRNLITPDDGQKISDPIVVDDLFISKYNPKAGGYYIMCENGVGLYSN